MQEIKGIKCVKCRKEIENIETKEKGIYGDIIQIYYDCPFCGNYNPVFRVNSQVDKMAENLGFLYSEIVKEKDKEIKEAFIEEYRRINGQRFSLLKMLNRA
jgi:hypothetical protein